MNFFTSGLSLSHRIHALLTWFELPRGFQQRQSANGNAHSIRVLDSRALLWMKRITTHPLTQKSDSKEPS